MLNCMQSTPPKEGKFCALFKDGSGAMLFLIIGEEMFDADGEFYHISNALDYLQDKFSHWYPLPNNFKLFYEQGE